MLEAAGPAFIKWGQWAATRHDLFPPDFCAILEHLHTQVSVKNGPCWHSANQNYHHAPVSKCAPSRASNLFLLDLCAILEHLTEPKRWCLNIRDLGL